MAIKQRKPTVNLPIFYNSRAYVDEPTYMTQAHYTVTQLATARAAGLPYVKLKLSGREKRYYNMEDSQKWHAGE